MPPRRPKPRCKQSLGVKHWVHDASWVDSLVLLESQPTINIEGLVAGYTGPGGKTVLPHRAVAKIDMRLVPDMTTTDTLAKLKAHLAKHGFGDIEVNMSGGYNPTQTDPDSRLIKTQLATYRKLGVDPQLWPRSAGSWPGYVFTDAPLKLCRRATSAWATAPGRTRRMSTTSSTRPTRRCRAWTAPSPRSSSTCTRSRSAACNPRRARRGAAWGAYRRRAGLRGRGLARAHATKAGGLG